MSKRALRKGDLVEIRDENNQNVVGVIREISQANDGTGRIGPWVEVANAIYWRKTARLLGR